MEAEANEHQKQQEVQIRELKEKVKWFRENQRLLAEGDQES